MARLVGHSVGVKGEVGDQTFDTREADVSREAGCTFDQILDMTALLIAGAAQFTAAQMLSGKESRFNVTKCGKHKHPCFGLVRAKSLAKGNYEESMSLAAHPLSVWSCRSAPADAKLSPRVVNPSRTVASEACRRDGKGKARHEAGLDRVDQWVTISV